MSDTYCRSNCVGTAVIISIIIGAVAAVLSFASIITLTTVFYWAAFAAALAVLLFTVLTAALSYRNERCCISRVFNALLTGIFGTIAVSLIPLTVPAAASGAVGAVITGLLFIFLTLILTSLVCLIKCIVND